MNISQMLGNDPDVLRYQLMQQEMQRYNQYQDPRMNLASTLGGLLGGGVVNVAQGRGFFQSNNPILKKASDLQNIYNQTAQSIDPNTSPGEFYKTLQQNLAAAGYGQQAAMAGAEAYKYSQEERKFGLQERQVKAAEAKVTDLEKTTMVTDKGYPISFKPSTGDYIVRGEVYDPTLHGGVRNPTDKLGSLRSLGDGSIPTGKDGKTEKLTDEQKREIWNNQNKPADNAPAVAPAAKTESLFDKETREIEQGKRKDYSAEALAQSKASQEKRRKELRKRDEEYLKRQQEIERQRNKELYQTRW